MNVTIKLSDELCKAAKHRAIDESKSLSKWVAELLERELAGQKQPARSLVEILGDPLTADRDFPLPDRNEGTNREIEFD
ncbi:MAG: hypothetical protein OSA84_10205 [Akkermansiaceae bacterium]|nr:hypothetical protein [Akkermansiaceae bacterium]